MRLKHGVTARHAIGTLNDLAGKANSIRPTQMHNPDEVRGNRDQYLGWAETAEYQLRSLFADRELLGALHSERYWRIHELDRYSARPAALLTSEIDAQLQELRDVTERLESHRQLAERSGEVLVVDTNTFMHCTLFTDLDWAHEFGNGEVRLVLPLLVLDELDDKTFSANARLSKRASKVLRILDPFLDAVLATGSADVGVGVSLEVLQDNPGHRRRGNNDTELLDRAEFLAQVIERPVTLVTTDYGMRVRGKARDLAVRVMPDRFRLPLTED